MPADVLAAVGDGNHDPSSHDSLADGQNADVSRSEGSRSTAAKQSRDVRVRPSLAKADLSAKSKISPEKSVLNAAGEVGEHTGRVNYHARRK